jgi:hypothetical protein
MHAVMVQFNCDAAGDRPGFIADQLAAFCTTEGLVSTTWFGDGEILGGFLVFVDRLSAETYLNGDLFDAIMLNPACGHFKVGRHDVIEHLSQAPADVVVALATKPVRVISAAIWEAIDGGVTDDHGDAGLQRLSGNVVIPVVAVA